MDASSPTALAAAVRRLHTAYDVVGVVEHMDDSVRLMARRLPKFFPSVDTTSPSALHLNRNPHPPVSALASGLLSAWNSNDLALYVLRHLAGTALIGTARCTRGVTRRSWTTVDRRGRYLAGTRRQSGSCTRPLRLASVKHNGGPARLLHWQCEAESVARL